MFHKTVEIFLSLVALGSAIVFVTWVISDATLASGPAPSHTDKKHSASPEPAVTTWAVTNSESKGNGTNTSPFNLRLASSGKPVLSSLAVSAGTLSPVFSGDLENYTVPDVPYSTRVLTISADADSGIGVSFWHFPNGEIAELIDEDEMAAGHQMSLDIGVKTVEVSVAKGSQYRDYRLVITRGEPTVSIRALTAEPATEGDTLRFEITRSAAPSDPLAVRVYADELDAMDGKPHDDILPHHLEDKSPEYYIEGGDNTAILELETTNDDKWENHSKVVMTILAGDLYTIDAGGGVATIVVHDDEFVASEAVLSVAPNPVGEESGYITATVTVTASVDKLPHGEVTIPLTTSDNSATAGSDYTGVNTTLYFAEVDFSEVTIDGNTRYRAAKTTDITISQDLVVEEDESFEVSMGMPSDSLVTRDEDASAISVTISDDDTAVAKPTLTGLTVGTGTLTPGFSSSHLSYSVPDIEYSTHLVTVTATPEAGASISFLDSSNEVVEDMDDMSVGHQVYLGIGETTLKIRVTEGDLMQDYTLAFARAKPVVSIRALTTGPAKEGDSIRFEVIRSAAAGDILQLRVGLDELGVDTDEEPGNVLPEAVEASELRAIAENQSVTEIVVESVGDTEWEKHSKVEMALKPEDWYDIDPEGNTASVVVQDDDFPEAEAVLSVSPNPVGEPSGKTVATVVVTTADQKMPHGDVSIQITTSDDSATAGEDFKELDRTLVFKEEDFGLTKKGNKQVYEASKTVEIKVLEDSLDEDSEAFTIMLGKPSRGILELNSDSKTVRVTIDDANSKPIVTVSTTPSPAIVLGRGVVVLNSMSGDSDNDSLTYAWTSAPDNAGAFNEPANESTTWMAPPPEVEEQQVTVRLTVTDDGMPQEQTTVEVEVTVEANAAPTARASASVETVNGGGSVALTGEGEDPEKGLLTYTWSGSGQFADSTASTTMWTAPDATDDVQILTLTLTVVDEHGLTGTASVFVSVLAANKPPSFPSMENGVRHVNEDNAGGSNVGAPVTAQDEEGDQLTYSLGGTDARHFTVDSEGQIKTATGTTLDYEAKRTYEVVVSVTDGRDLNGNVDTFVDATKQVVINVDDVEEEGAIVLSEPLPQVGSEITARVLDPDNYMSSDPSGRIPDTSVDSWLWERSDDIDGPWETISGATSARYTSVIEDIGAHLRVTAMYADRRGTGKVASTISGKVRSGAPSAPTSLHVSYSSTIGGLAVSWSPPVSDGGEPVTEYRVALKLAPASHCPTGGGWEDGSGPGTMEGGGLCKAGVEEQDVTETTHEITSHGGESLVVGDFYDVRVAARNSVGLGGWSGTVRVKVPSSDARLITLSVSPVDISDFTAETTQYDVTMEGTVTQATIDAAPADTNATVIFGPSGDIDDSMDGYQVALESGENPFTVTVTAEDGVTARVYTVVITQVSRNSPPSVFVSPSSAIVNACNAIKLYGTSGDPENGPLTYSWTASPDIGQFSSNSTGDTVWTAPLPEGAERTVELTLTVTDSMGMSASDAVLVTVRADT